MKKYRALLLTLTLISVSATAEKSYIGTGIGHLYGGLLGVQGSYNTENNKYRASLGLFGLGMGYERKITENQAIGTTFGVFIPQGALYSVDWVYYFSGTFQQGWAINGSIARSIIPQFSAAGSSTSERASNSFAKHEDQAVTIALISVGYHF